MAEQKFVSLANLEYYDSKLKTFVANTYVAKEAGKGLSSNDFTNALKTKLDNIDTGAQVNVIEKITLNGTELPVSNKTVALQNVVVDANYIHTDNNFTDALKESYDETVETVASLVSTGGEPNVIEAVKVNGTALKVTDKAVDITVPTQAASIATGQTGYATGAQVASALSGYVTKETGKGLSTNDYTTAEKNKLSGIASGAQANVIESVKVNGTALTVSEKAVNITMPTKVSDLTNDSGFQTAAQVATAIGNAVDDITSFEYQVVTALPSTGEKGVIYLVSHSHGTSDVYDEYIYVNNAFEKIGNTDIDLSGYVKNSDLVAITNSEIDALFA